MQQTPNQIVLNGAHGEGGGALLRSAVTVASFTQQPVTVYNVRGSLRKKGLTSEDLTFVTIASDSTSAELEGAFLESDELTYRPRSLPKPLAGQYDIHSHKKGTVPGNAILLLLSAIPLLARAKGYSELAVCGETHNERTIGYDAFERSTLAAMKRMGVYAYPRLLHAGFGYGARGEVSLEVEPSTINAVEWPTRGELVASGVTVTLTDLPEKFGNDVFKGLERLAENEGLSLENDLVQVSSGEPGASVTVWAEFERGYGSGTATHNRERSADEVASLAFSRFMEWYGTDATVDAYLADQILLIAAQAEERTVFATPSVTQRLATVAWVVRQFMPIHLTIHGKEGEPGIVTIER